LFQLSQCENYLLPLNSSTCDWTAATQILTRDKCYNIRSCYNEKCWGYSKYSLLDSISADFTICYWSNCKDDSDNIEIPILVEKCTHGKFLLGNSPYMYLCSCNTTTLPKRLLNKIY